MLQKLKVLHIDKFINVMYDNMHIYASVNLHYML